MRTLPQDAFIKPKSLTEAAFSIVNKLWAKIENYIPDPEAWRQTVLSGAKWTNNVSDVVLEKLIANHFIELLESHGFTIEHITIALYKNKIHEDIMGSCTVKVLNATNTLKQQKNIKLKIDICIYQLKVLTGKQIFQTLYHELVHIEQDCKALIGIGIEKLSDSLTSFLWTNVDDVLNKAISHNDIDYANSKNEIAPYAGDIAYEIFNKYKQELKNKTEREQDIFIRTHIIPNIRNEFSKDIKNNFVDALSDPKQKHKFYILLVQQLKELASRISNNG